MINSFKLIVPIVIIVLAVSAAFPVIASEPQEIHSTNVRLLGSRKTYVVQPGDSLYTIGLTFGVSWQSIATANSILPPYIIYIGQSLIIPSSGGTTTSPQSSSSQYSSSTFTSTSCSTTQSISALYYTVQPGDSLYQISLNFGISWESIATANNVQSPYIIYIGESLLIPSGGTVSNSSCSSSSTSSSSSSSSSQDSTSASKSSNSTTASSSSISSSNSSTSSSTSSSSTSSTSSSSTSSSTSSSSYLQYTVQPGDYLYLIGQKFNVPWQTIAQANNIQSPYVLYVGEVLQIPTSGSSSSTSCTLPSSPLVSGPRNVAQELPALNSSQKYVVLRFDDSFQDQWVNALPVLEQYHFKAVFLAVTGSLTNQGLNFSAGDGWANLSWQEMEWLYNNGFEIADHTVTHANLNHQSCSGLNYEIYQSRQALFNQNMTFIPALATPYGVPLNGDNYTVMKYILASGYSYVYPDDQTQGTGILNYSQVGTQWFDMSKNAGESFSRFTSIVSQASSTFVVGLMYHHIDDHVCCTSYYTNSTNFQREMKYLANNNYTVIVPAELPNY